MLNLTEAQLAEVLRNDNESVTMEETASVILAADAAAGPPMPSGLEHSVDFLTEWTKRVDTDVLAVVARHIRNILPAVRRGVTVPEARPAGPRETRIVMSPVVDMAGLLDRVNHQDVRIAELETNAQREKARLDNDLAPRLAKCERHEHPASYGMSITLGGPVDPMEKESKA